MHINLNTIGFILRLGLAFTYIFIGILCFSAQSALVEYASPLITANNSVLSFSIIGIISLAFAGWILSGKHTRLSSIISFLILILVLVLNIEKSFVIFAVLETLCLNLALIFSERLKMNTNAPAPVLIADKVEDKAETLL